MGQYQIYRMKEVVYKCVNWTNMLKSIVDVKM